MLQIPLWFLKHCFAERERLKGDLSPWVKTLLDISLPQVKSQMIPPYSALEHLSHNQSWSLEAAKCVFHSLESVV